MIGLRLEFHNIKLIGNKLLTRYMSSTGRRNHYGLRILGHDEFDLGPLKARNANGEVISSRPIPKVFFQVVCQWLISRKTGTVQIKFQYFGVRLVIDAIKAQLKKTFFLT